jgi:hypothetical protein
MKKAGHTCARGDKEIRCRSNLYGAFVDGGAAGAFVSFDPVDESAVGLQPVRIAPAVRPNNSNTKDSFLFIVA